MSRSKEIRIPFNKFKLTLFFIGSLIFVALGFHLLGSDYVPPRTMMRHDLAIHIFGGRVVGPDILAWVTILFFGLIALTILHKLFFRKYAVIITKKELITNATGFRTKRIPFDTIFNLDVRKYRGNTMIRVEYVIPKWNDPNTFLDRATYINKNNISFDFHQLFEILQERVNLE